MGISRAAVHYMMTEAKKVPFRGRLLTLGVQQTTVSEADLNKLSKRLNYPLVEVGDEAIEKFDRHQHLTDLYLFKRLGFEEVLRTDFSDFEGADFAFDMNQAGVPEQYLGYFDLLIDGGTTEHVFHLPNSLHNIFSFLNVGGRIMHFSPSSNHVDHGFYMFSPTLFWDYYLANGFEFSSFKFFEYNRWGNVNGWMAADYEPGCLRFISGGGLPGGQYGIALTATKTAQSTSGVIPQQHRYAKTWARKKKRKSHSSLLVYRFKKRAERIWKRYRVRGFPLPVNDRY